MDGYDEDSTDEEFGVNLQLTERLRLNRGECSSRNVAFEDSKEFKQYCNMKKKELGAHSSSTSSNYEHHKSNDSTLQGTPSPYMLPNKKRQIVDKSQEQSANPKRTCLSDRFSRSPECKGNKKGGHAGGRHPLKVVSESKFSYPNRYRAELNLSPDKTYELDVSNSEDSDSDDSHNLFNFTKGPETERKKILLRPPSSPLGACMSSYKNKYSSRRGVQFVESDSDESSKSMLQNGALKGGKRSPDYCTKKVIGRRNIKVLDSDDTDDEKWHVKYRNRPIYFSSSESEDSRSVERELISGSKALVANQSSPYINKAACFECPSDKVQNSTFQPPSFGCDSGVSSKAGCQYKTKNSYTSQPETSSYKAQNGSTHEPVFPSFNNSCSKFSPPRSSSISSRQGRSHRKRGTRHTHRPSSPHPQGHCSTELPRSSTSRRPSIRRSRTDSSKLDLIATYPGLFDTEDSSEFFTANSYSDTETSNESLFRNKGVNQVNHPDSRTSSSVATRDHSNNVGSSEDEISVIFSSSFPPPSRESSIATLERPRPSGTRGRRYNARGTTRSHVQGVPDIVSLSPDPVEQVRQMEEDERFARMLQDQFDAELRRHTDQQEVFNAELRRQTDQQEEFNAELRRRNIQSCPFPPPPGDEVGFIGDSDSDRFTSFPPPSSSESDEEFIDPVGDSDSVRYTPATSSESSPRFPVARRPVMSLYSRGRMQAFAPRLLLFQNNRRPRSRSRNNRRRFGSVPDPWMWQFTRILGLGETFTSNLDSIENEYETLLELAEANGEAIQRGLQKSEINRLPTRKYLPPNSARSSSSTVEVPHKRAELNKECQVCLNDYESGDVLRILPCFHEFHTPCIDPWLKINHTCPVCRVTVDLGESIG